MRYLALLLLCSLALVACGGGGGGSQPNPCDGVEVTLVIEHFLDPVQNSNQLLPFQSGWWGITLNGAPTNGGTVFVRDPFGVTTTLTIGNQDTGRYFTPDVAGTWEMWGQSASGCTTATETFLVYPYTIEMVFGDKFVSGGQDWGIADASSGQGIVGTPTDPVMLTFFDAVGNLQDIVEIDNNATLKFYTPNQNIIGAGFVVGMTSNGEVTPIRQFNLVDPGCDIGLNFPGFILPKALQQQIDIELFGSASHSGGNYTIRHEGDIIEQMPIFANETSFSWTPPYDGMFTIELDLSLPCGSRSSLPYPVMVR